MDTTVDLKNCVERRRVRDRDRDRERELGLVSVGCSREHQVYFSIHFLLCNLCCFIEFFLVLLD